MKGYDLKAIRAEASVLQTELADEIGIGVPTLVDIEYGRVEIDPDYHARLVAAIQTIRDRKREVVAA